MMHDRLILRRRILLRVKPLLMLLLSQLVHLHFFGHRRTDYMAVNHVCQPSSTASFSRVMCDENHGKVILSVQPVQKLHDFVSGFLVQVSGGFISQKNAWVVDDASCYGNALLFSPLSSVGLWEALFVSPTFSRASLAAFFC